MVSRTLGNLLWPSKWPEWKGEGCLAGRFFFSRNAEEIRTPNLVQNAWILSPGSGDKVIVKDYSFFESSLALFECSSGRQLFKNFYRDRITLIQFSPDSNVIIFSILFRSTHLLSSTTGQIMWTQEWMNIARFAQFLLNGEGIVVEDRRNLYIATHLYGDRIQSLEQPSLIGIPNSSIDWFGLVLPTGGGEFQTLFFDAQDGKPIIASSLYLLPSRVLYGNYSAISLSLPRCSSPSLAHHYIAYQDKDKVIVVNLSPIM
jgi:hypothetical protein